MRRDDILDEGYQNSQSPHMVAYQQPQPSQQHRPQGEGRFGAELLGEGDLLRPSQGEFDSPLLPLETGWLVPEPARGGAGDDPVGL